MADDDPRLPGEAVLEPRAAPAGLASGAAQGRLLAAYEIGRQLLEQREPGEVLRAILAALVRDMRPDHACVLAAEAPGEYRPIAVHELDLSGPQAGWPLSHTVLRRAEQSGLAVLAEDARADAQLGGAQSIERFRIRSVLCVPLGERPARGLVYLDNRSDRPFRREDLQFLSAVALHASLVLERALERQRAAEALEASGERLSLLQGELLRHRIVGRSPKLLAAYDALRRFARGGARVLLRGETGTGKELFARAYALSGPRAGAAYVPVPIPALAAGLVESELFGHVKGAFTEASRDKKGRLELAHGGVLFLDEVGDIEPALQTKLLRFLDSGELVRVGDTELRRVDAWIVSATNRPLERDVADGRFREDLLARLGQAVVIPPLRERREDVPLLAEHFLAQEARGRPPKRFTPEALAELQDRPWPLNVRELQQAVQRAACLVDGETISAADLAAPPGARPAAAPGQPPRPLRDVVREAERAAIAAALEFTDGNKKKAIELLQISSETFYRRLQELGLRGRD